MKYISVILASIISSSVAVTQEALSQPVDQQAAEATVDFAQHVKPILEERCFSCHGAEKQKNGLRLDVRDDALRGGDSGAPITPGDADNSLLVKLISGLDDTRVMPPQGERLAPEQIAVIKAWIQQGAAWPEEHSAAPQVVQSDHWAFKSPVRPEIPSVKQAAWVRNPIDAFVLAKLESTGIQPSPEADRVMLIRRLHFDLTGIPPTADEVDAFVNDPSPYAYESLVNRLLASPHFGERWARYWLDLARYADSDGYEKDLPRPYAYRYRDWLIDSLNRDMPYDQFVIEQLAGDLIPNATTDSRIATGFHRNTLTNREGGIDPEEDRVKQAVDRTNTVSTVFLGLTMACAQCHSHKYDPLTQREYYQLYSFFNTSIEKDIPAPTEG
jgi:cytochrome c553